MSDQIKFSTFPRDKFEALALLYVQAQDLSEKTPAQILALYKAAYSEIKEANSIS